MVVPAGNASSGCSDHLHALRLSGSSSRRSFCSLTASRISIHALREEGDGSLHTVRTRRCNFYPRPPRGGRPPGAGIFYALNQFLSTPSARRATGVGFFHIVHFQFLSTPSARRATQYLSARLQSKEISIHALREEGDVWSTSYGAKQWRFLSTPSARRATRFSRCCNLFYPISIHALREEGDPS